MKFLHRVLPAIGVATTLLIAPLAAHAQQNYIALGDSYAFGYSTSTTSAGNGNQGYASILRGVFASRSGQTVTLTNLAIPGETTGSYFNGTTTISPYSTTANPIYDGPARTPAFNTNYATTPDEFQTQKFSDTVAALGAANVNYVTLQVGGNDVLGLFGQANFRSLSSSDQTALINNRFQNLSVNLNNILTGIKTQTPNAKVYVFGYADVFAGLGVSNPIPQSKQLTLTANSLISGLATQYNATYVDIYSPFVGNETIYSRILTQDPPGSGNPNVHPTDLGYQVIASQAAAPEPGTIALVLVGACPLIGAAVRRRKHRH